MKLSEIQIRLWFSKLSKYHFEVSHFSFRIHEISVRLILVDDVATLLSSMLGRQTPHVMNVGGPAVVSIRQIAEQVGRLVSKQPVWEIGSRSSDIIADISTMKEFLGGTHLTSFTDGLETLVNSITNSN